MHEMWTILTDVSVVWCISLSVTHLCTAKMAEWIKVLFAVETLGGPRNAALDVGHDSPWERGVREMLPVVLCII